MIDFVQRRIAHRGYVTSYRAELTHENYLDPLHVFQESKNKITNILNSQTLLRLRILICVNVLFFKRIGENEIRNNFYFSLNYKRILSSYLI